MAALLSVSVAGAAAAPALIAKPICCVPNEPIAAVAVSGNTAYIGGYFKRLGHVTGGFALLDPATGSTRKVSPEVDGQVSASASDGNGGWYIAGGFTAVGGVARAGMAHVLADGTVDPSWAPSTDGQVAAMVVLGGRVYVGGRFATVIGGVPRESLAAFDAVSGAVIASFADDITGGGGSVNALRAHSGITAGTSRLYVGGSFTAVGATARQDFAVIDPENGALIGSDPGLNGPVRTLAVGGTFNAPIVYVGGDFDLPRQHLAAFGGITATFAGWDPRADASVSALAVSGSTVYAGGEFTKVNVTTARAGLASFDRTSGVATSWAPSVSWDFGPSAVYGLAAIGGTVYVGGLFTKVDGTSRRDLAALDATSGELTGWDPDAGDANAIVAHMATDGTSILAGGRFQIAGGIVRHHLAAVDLTTGELTGFDPDLDGPVEALAVSGSTLYVGGAFSSVNGGTTRRGLAAFDMATGVATAFDPNLNVGGEARALALSGDTIFAAGFFITANGTVPRGGLARFDASTGALTPFRIDPDEFPSALALSGSTLYVGGGFNHVGGVPRRGLAAIEVDSGGTGSLTTLDVGLDGSAFALSLDGPNLYIGGRFSSLLGGIPRHNAAALDTSTRAVTGWDPGADNDVTALAPTDQSVFAGGPFATIGGAARNGLAALEPSSGALADWDGRPSGTTNALGWSPEGGLVAGGDMFLGAFALPPAAPAAPVATAGDRAASVAFAAPPSGGAPISSYTVTASPGAQTATGSSSPIAVGGLAEGTTYMFTVTASNAAGTGRPSAPSNTVTPRSGRSAAIGAVADTLAPRLSRLRVTNRRFAVAKSQRAISVRAKRGTVFLFSVSEDAATTITIERALPGRRRGKACVTPRNGLKKRCTRYRFAGTLTRATRSGPNRVPFTGRIGARALAPGNYRATVVATDPNGKRSAPVATSLTVTVSRTSGRMHSGPPFGGSSSIRRTAAFSFR